MTAPTPPAPTAAARPVALVTGAARRIGRSIALHLAAHGWDVVLHHRHSAADAEAPAAEARTAGARAWLLAAAL
ncbi:MAG: short-chain dehydrogenase, partial [Burkholderiales bacterium PBB5]